MLFRLFNTLLAWHTPAQVVVDGARLQSVGRQIWVADRELLFAGVRFPARMVVAANEAGDLLCYSPVGLDEATTEALAGIGDVRWIIAPNRHHTLFAHEYLQRFPAARMVAVAPIGDCAVQIADSPINFGVGFESALVNLRRDYRELVIYHDLSETLILADLLFNIQSGDRRLEWVLRLNGAWRRAGHTRVQRLLVMRDRQGLGEFYRWALARPFVQITMSHGQVIKHDAREVFYRTFRPYL